MSQTLRPSDRRAFGRRDSSLHAMARMSGRAPEPCIVRDFSESGARLEFPGAVEPTAKFRLVIDAKGFEAECEVRRRMGNEVGVSFAGATDGRHLAGDDAAESPTGDSVATAPDEPPTRPAAVLRPSLGRRVVMAVPGHEMRSKLFG